MALRVRGTQDNINMRLFDAIVKRIEHQLHLHNFAHVSTPIIESIELFERVLNQGSDIVHKEMFLLQQRSAEDQLLCLRPEATAPIARSFIDNGIQLLPWCVYSCGPMFRYERPQKGRYRQFNQFTIEMIGAADISHDVQLITMLDRLFERTFHLEEYALLINFLGSTQDRASYTTALRSFLETHQAQLCSLCQERTISNTLRVLDCKNPTCQKLYKQAPALADYYSDASKKQWELIQEQLRMLSVSYSVDPRLVRGLDYYNDTVFEFVSPALGAQATFCAGGRYDGLLAQIDPKYAQPACGAAIGLERLLLLLEDQQELFIPQLPSLHIIIPLSAQEKILALLLADTLISDGLTVQVLLDDASVKSRMRKASKLGAATVLMLGQQEREQGMVTVKNMTTGQQEMVRQTEVTQLLKI